jgi:predicted nucleic acid-binding protein
LSVFVDTSAFYATLDRSDRHNARAEEILAAEREPLVTTDHVLVETWRLAHVRLGRDVAERFWGALRSGSATVESVLPTDLDTAWRIGRDFPDQDFSIVDRTSFAVMGRLGVSSVVSFDDHFSIYRYGTRRERAFEVRR